MEKFSDMECYVLATVINNLTVASMVVRPVAQDDLPCVVLQVAQTVVRRERRERALMGEFDLVEHHIKESTVGSLPWPYPVARDE
jgi:hypothetical protein